MVLGGSEKNSSMKLELLGLKWAVTETFRDLLISATLIVYTDNNPLSYLQTTGKLEATVTRWVAAHVQFDFFKISISTEQPECRLS